MYLNGVFMENDIVIAPSLICSDLCNLEKEVKLFESINLKYLHVDIIDPHFSPSMPIGLSTVKQLRYKSNMSFDIHIMSTLNEFFIRELVDMSPNSIIFHYETSLHTEKMLQLIKERNIKTGIALNPATPINVLEFIASNCDYILLMLINPGYADGKNEKIVPYALKKIKELKKFLNKNNYSSKIMVDGRVSMDIIPNIIEAGAQIIVGGTGTIFRKGYSYIENCKEVSQIINKFQNMNNIMNNI